MVSLWTLLSSGYAGIALNLSPNSKNHLRILLDQLFLILSYGGIILALFIVLLLNNKGVRKSRANIFLSVLLLAFAFTILHIRYAGNVLNHLSVRVYNVGDPTFFLIAPLLWFYTKELTGHKVKLSLNSVLHFLPFLVICICSLTFSSIPPDHPFILVLKNHNRLPIIFFWGAVVVQFSCYQIFLHQRWSAYQQALKQEVSNTEDVNISWVRFFMGVFLGINLFFLFSLFAVIHLDYLMWIWKAVAVMFSLSVFALGYKGILQREIFYQSIVENSAPAPGMSPLEKEKTDPDLIAAVLRHMETKKPYLDSELTLSQLAKELNISRSQLSQVINEGIGDNFYNFINKYRVAQVKKFMSDPEMQNYSLLGMALEAGFKSKSTFNLIFKRFTGLTPTEFKKNISE